jgi:hypothetical protein
MSSFPSAVIGRHHIHLASGAGDTRLGSMETGQALVRALVATAAHKCDIINMSYGGRSRRLPAAKYIPSRGRRISR